MLKAALSLSHFRQLIQFTAASPYSTTMEYNFLGKTGLRVSNLCLGTMTFGETPNRPANCSEALSHELLDAFVQAGGNFIDTADCYQAGLSERIVGNWLKKQSRRDKFVLATKLGQVMDQQDPNNCGGSRHHVMTAVTKSLERLQTDYIDLLYLHVWDDSTPIEETLKAMTDLVKAGKVRYIGASNFTGWQVQKASDTAKFLGLEAFCCLQEQYNLLVREPEWEVLEACKRENVSVLPWSPLKGGWLSGKMKRNVGAPPEGSRVHFQSQPGRKPQQSGPDWRSLADDDRTWNVLDVCENIAKNKGKSVAQVSLRWLLQQPNIPSVVIGAKTLAQLKDNLGAADWRLSEEEIVELTEASSKPKPYPYGYDSREAVEANRRRNDFVIANE